MLPGSLYLFPDCCSFHISVSALLPWGQPDTMSIFERAKEWEFDLDRYLNRIVPPSPLYKLPTPVTRFLGYRKEKHQDVGNVLGAFWSMVGAFCGLAVIAAVFNNTESIQRHTPPALIASFVSLSIWCCGVDGMANLVVRVRQQFSSTMPSSHHLDNHEMPSLDIHSQRSSALVSPNSSSIIRTMNQSNG
jgi:hypothetical protein